MRVVPRGSHPNHHRAWWTFTHKVFAGSLQREDDYS